MTFPGTREQRESLRRARGAPSLISQDFGARRSNTGPFRGPAFWSTQVLWDNRQLLHAMLPFDRGPQVENKKTIAEVPNTANLDGVVPNIPLDGP